MGDCMNNNIRTFSEYLEKEDIAGRMLEEDNLTMFVFNADIESGPKAKMVVFFPHDSSIPDWLVKIEAFDYVKIDNPAKRENILEKLNELNNKSVFEKFVLLNDGSVIIKMNYTYYGNFDPDQLTGMLFHLDDVLRDEYSGFMKLIWG